MGTILSIEKTGKTEHLVAVYQDDSGEEYEVVLCENQDMNAGYEWREIVHIEKDGLDIEVSEPLRSQILEAVDTVETEAQDGIYSVQVRIPYEELSILNSLMTYLVQGGKGSTPEEALEMGIFTQIKEQLRTGE